jgi:hypothetical protein
MSSVELMRTTKQKRDEARRTILRDRLSNNFYKVDEIKLLELSKKIYLDKEDLHEIEQNSKDMLSLLLLHKKKIYTLNDSDLDEYEKEMIKSYKRGVNPTTKPFTNHDEYIKYLVYLNAYQQSHSLDNYLNKKFKDFMKEILSPFWSEIFYDSIITHGIRVHPPPRGSDQNILTLYYRVNYLNITLKDLTFLIYELEQRIMNLEKSTQHSKRIDSMEKELEKKEITFNSKMEKYVEKMIKEQSILFDRKINDMERLLDKTLKEHDIMKHKLEMIKDQSNKLVNKKGTRSKNNNSFENLLNSVEKELKKGTKSKKKL